MPRRTILFAFFLTGACGLVYEVLWARMLGLVFGNTTYAISTVLAAFMGGLALGSFFFGRVADYLAPNSANSTEARAAQGGLLKLYAILEVGVGLYALLTPVLLEIVETAYVGFYRSISTSRPLATFLCFILTFLMILIPTTLMGGTLPILSKLFSLAPGEQERRGRRYDLGRSVGILYSINTWGAVLGAFLSAYLLIGQFGVTGTLRLAAFANLAIAACIYFLSQKAAGSRWTAVLRTAVGARVSSSSTSSTALLLAIGLSGLTAFGFEVAWTRVLSMVIGSSIHAFSTMLSVFLAGIALGSLLYARLDRSRWLSGPNSGIVLFGVLEAGIGMSALLLLPLLGNAPSAFVRLVGVFGGDLVGVQIVQFVTCFVILILPTTLFGATVPLACKLYREGRQTPVDVGRSVGDVYGANTLGSIAGSLAAGFALIPWLGLQTTMVVVALINVVLAAVLLLVGLQQRRWACGLSLASLLLFTAIYLPTTPPWDRSELLRAVYFLPSRFLGTQAPSSEQKLLFYSEGASATVAVTEERMRSSGEVYKAVVINGWKVAASSRLGLIPLKVLGHLPLLLHPDPMEEGSAGPSSKPAEEVLIVGLGAGVNAGAAGLYPVVRIDQVEIEPEVIRAATFFEKENHHILRDPRLRMIIEDGRNWLLKTEKLYDIISTDPILPHDWGSASLYSREYFSLCKSRLNESGVMAQWFPLSLYDPREIKMLIRTFADVFPYASLWHFGRHIILIGSPSEIRLDYRKLQQKLSKPLIKKDLEPLNLATPRALLRHFVMDREDLLRYTEGVPLNTDDRPRLELSAPKAITMGGNSSKMVFELRSVRSQPRIEHMPEGLLE